MWGISHILQTIQGEMMQHELEHQIKITSIK